MNRQIVAHRFMVPMHAEKQKETLQENKNCRQTGRQFVTDSKKFAELQNQRRTFPDRAVILHPLHVNPGVLGWDI